MGPAGTLVRQHAWIRLPDGRVYDPVLDQYFISEREYLGTGGFAEVVYTRKQTAKKSSNLGHYGPWHHTKFEPYSGPHISIPEQHRRGLLSIVKERPSRKSKIRR